MNQPNLSHRQPLCARCVQNLTCKRNEVLVRLSENRIVEADLWQCPSCGCQIVTGFAQEYVDRHDRPELFEAWDKGLQTLGPTVIIGAPYMNEVYAEAA